MTRRRAVEIGLVVGVAVGVLIRTARVLDPPGLGAPPPAQAEADEQGNIRKLPEDPEPAPISIHDAATAGDAGRLEELLEQNPLLVNARDGSGRTPLHYAAVQSEVEAAKLLLTSGADLRVRDQWGATPLACVGTGEEPLAWDRCAEMAALLLSHGADANTADENGYTPLHNAAFQGHTDVADLLLRHGADVNARDNSGSTPLHESARWFAAETARLLLDQPGIEVNVRNKAGKTPSQIARQKNAHALILRFEQAGGE